MSATPKNSPPADRVAAARQLLRGAGLRVTPQRVAVLAVLERADGRHLSADDVWQQLHRGPSAMDRSTAYRVLSDLTGSGILQQANLGDGVTRFEIQNVAHHHAVCTACGATEDVSAEVISVLTRRLRAASGFVLGVQPLLLPGLCAACSTAHTPA